MNEQDIVQFCVKHRINVDQYFFMWMVLNKDEWSKAHDESSVKQYLERCGVFDDRHVRKLVERGLVMDMNAPGQSEVNFYVVSDEVADEMIVNEEMAEQLWNLYPPTMPLSNGGYFISRGGADKEDILKEYRRRIRNSPRKHKHVIEQLDRFKNMVVEGRINGCKLIDFVREERWDTIAAIPASEEGGSFAKDI